MDQDSSTIKALIRTLSPARLANKWVSWIKPRSSKPAELSLIRYCQSRGYYLTKSGIPKYLILTPNGTTILCTPRPSARHRVRARTYTIMAILEQAMRRNQLVLARYDPDDNLQDYHHQGAYLRDHPPTQSTPNPNPKATE